jgi:hypothetical protein
MTRRCLGVALAVALAVCLTRQARADSLPPPTVFEGALHGMLVGAVAGAATGYIFARDDTWNKSGGWKPIAYGTGIGALSGAALGLTLGIVDMTQNKPHRNAYVMRDGLYGAGLGFVLGGIAGGMAAISSKKAENILLGGSIGVLAGTITGIGIGFFEGYRKYSASVAAVQQSDGSLALLPSVAGRF